MVKTRYHAPGYKFVIVELPKQEINLGLRLMKVKTRTV